MHRYVLFVYFNKFQQIRFDTVQEKFSQKRLKDKCTLVLVTN